MSAYFYAPGAIEHFVTFRNGNSYYLGTALTAPEIEGRPFYLNVINDLGGRTAPMDKVGDRAQHVVTSTLNRFDDAILKTILGVVSEEYNHTTRTQGTLVFDSLDFELVLVYAAALAGYTPAGFPVGRRYWQSNVIGYRESTVGTRVQEVTLIFECNEIFTPSARLFSLASELTSEVTAGLPAVS